MSVERNEAKYQLIKLVHSGRTLTEAKSIMKAASAALHPEYTSAKDINNLATLEGGLNRLAMTRNQAKELAYKKFFKPRNDFPSTREESLAKFATGWKGKLPLNWKRDGNLVRRGPPNKPKPGSSAGKVRQTKVIGVENVLSGFKMLFKAIERLEKSGSKKGKGMVKSAMKSVKTSVKAGLN
tara:strand:- start:316 stop:861 length:546 start_codon:yes stop_codon:yes gene_type:complete